MKEYKIFLILLLQVPVVCFASAGRTPDLPVCDHKWDTYSLWEDTEEGFCFDVPGNHILKYATLQEDSGKNPSDFILKYLPEKKARLQFIINSYRLSEFCCGDFRYLKIPLYLLFRVLLL
jgi:hypothetical protein